MKEAQQAGRLFDQNAKNAVELRLAQLLQAPSSGHAWLSYYFARSTRQPVIPSLV
jgi:hypothetical protein